MGGYHEILTPYYYIVRLVRCLWWWQNLSAKNGNGAQKNVHIFKNNAPTLLKNGVFRSGFVMSSWNKMTCKSFVTKVT